MAGGLQPVGLPCPRPDASSLVLLPKNTCLMVWVLQACYYLFFWTGFCYLHRKYKLLIPVAFAMFPNGRMIALLCFDWEMCGFMSRVGHYRICRGLILQNSCSPGSGTKLVRACI